MSLLTIAQSAARRVGIGRPALVAAASDDLTLQLFDLAQEGVEEIGKRHGWRQTRMPTTFVTVAAQVQPSALPADYDRMAPGQTFWNQSQRLPVVGPASAEDWARITALALVSGPNLVYRLAGTGLMLYPAPAAGQTIAFEYVSMNRVRAADGTAKPTFTADTDTVLFPEHLVTKDLVWRWKAAKGLDYAEDMATFERAFEREAAADRGEIEVTTASGGLDMLPDTFWPGTISVV
ncbi:hypothetical protein [uncultured Methylobacterium sp.]|uniref:phage adaptor protein n=1 Tax=uncultured Methylobacterium sp. TaxID=157278 RepID=UPI0035CAAAE3